MNPRILCWFSSGAASTVATKEAILKRGETYEVIPVCCDTRPSEESDNYRFSLECEKWFGRPITYIRNEKYGTVDDVFEKTRYMAGIAGARCTTELKKIPRQRFAKPDDVHVFGFTFDELQRKQRFVQRNPELFLWWPLIEGFIRKQDCYTRLKEAGIELPRMYQLGFNNNNCPGCVKAQSPWYWSKIRTHFPEVFLRRCKQSREIGVRLVRLNGVRIFLDELPDGQFLDGREESISCGPECGQSELQIIYDKQ